ncbi:kinase domain protein [Dictyocaulus viviparus]|uniref:Kinase domain protein n=1 Tax=Dictyocaulus viviparus TaxID=29172 RepID=A0A0D8Y7W3_DICVI|nr:kinase domain protein [Dictyocaulus viviparus]
MMVSNIMVINDLNSSHVDGARCSARVFNSMLSKMASSCSTGIPLQNDSRASSKELGENHQIVPHPKSHPHPFAAMFGQVYAVDDFDVLERLGEGFFSKVSKVRLRSSGEEMVLKVAKCSGSPENRRSVHADVAREAEMLQRLSHDNILAIRGVCVQIVDDGCWDMHLLVDYCDGGSLSKLILDKTTTLPWCQRIRYTLDIALAMSYLHSQMIIHRDLTSMNVLLQLSRGSSVWGRAVVADFGLSCRFPQRGEKLPQVGTTYFMSPECLKEEYYDEKSDVFSFGVIVCQLIARIDADPDSGLHRTNGSIRATIFEMLVSLLQKISTMIPSSPSYTVLEVKGETKLARSRSDAALKKPASTVLASRKMSNNVFRMVRPIVEGTLSEENSLLAMERLARDVARDQPTLDHTNPFLDHERYRKERKILPKKNGRRRSEAKPEKEFVDGDYSGEEHIRRSVKRLYSTQRDIFRKRCFSLPPDVHSSLLSLGLDDEKREKFLKQMKRFPSRRHTLIPECNGVRSSLDLQSLKSHRESLGSHRTTSTTSQYDVVSSFTSIGHLIEIRPNTAAVVSGQHPSCFSAIPPEYSPNTGNRLNNNQFDVSACEQKRSVCSRNVVLETVVRTPTSVSSRMCVPKCEAAVNNTKHKCIIL